VRDKVTRLAGPEAKHFCIRLWYELTIAGRAIWSDDTLDQATQLNALKWLNEMQHRAWSAHCRDDDEALAWLLDRILAHCDEAPVLGFHARVALERSLAAVARPHPAA
jgi:hypothetical protein